MCKQLLIQIFFLNLTRGETDWRDEVSEISCDAHGQKRFSLLRTNKSLSFNKIRMFALLHAQNCTCKFSTTFF